MEILIVLENDHAFIEWVFTADVCKKKKEKNQMKKMYIISVEKKIMFFQLYFVIFYFGGGYLGISRSILFQL